MAGAWQCAVSSGDRIRGRRPVLLREDFCGTAQAACEWVATNRRHRAIAVDVDREVLDWSRKHHVRKLKPGARKRLELVRADVREVAACGCARSATRSGCGTAAPEARRGLPSRG